MMVPPQRRAAAAESLAAIDRPVSLFASALAGRTLALQLAAPGPAAQPDIIRLAPALLAGIAGPHPWGALRIEVLRHVVALQPGGRWSFDLGVARARALVGPRDGIAAGDGLQQCLASWPRSVLLRRLFRIIESGRVDVCIEQQFPGARADLQRLRTAALKRLDAARQPLRAWLDDLQRQALGSTDAQPASALAAAALASTATVYDSLQAAIALAALIGWGRGRSLAALPRWLQIEPARADAGGPAADDGTGASMPPEPAAAFAALALGHARVLGSALPPPTGVPSDGAKPPEQALALEPLLPVDALARPGSAADGFRHDEWNYLEQRYHKAWTQVHEQRLHGQDLRFLAQLRQRHAGLAASIRRRIGKLRPQARERVRRVRDGDEIDVDAAIEDRIERRAGHRGDARVYTALQPARREVCAAFLLDISGSTGFVVPDTEALAADDGAPVEDDPYFYASPRRSMALQPPRRRVIDVAKDAIGLMCDALARLGDRHAVWGFSGDGRFQVDFYVAKGFDEPWSAASAAALARMEPKGSTRTGAAIRHAARQLARQSERMRLLIVVTDGYPQDSDYGPDPQDSEYGLRDTAQAMREAERAGIAVFCVSVDHAAHDYLRRVCPASRYLVIDEVADLPEQLAKVYRRLVSRR
jgi:nitric oxide reductase NorD protein